MKKGHCKVYYSILGIAYLEVSCQGPCHWPDAALSRPEQLFLTVCPDVTAGSSLDHLPAHQLCHSLCNPRRRQLYCARDSKTLAFDGSMFGQLLIP